MNLQKLFQRSPSIQNLPLSAKANSQFGKLDKSDAKNITASLGLISKLKIQKVDSKNKKRKFVFESNEED